jgi:hypothetical protein
MGKYVDWPRIVLHLPLQAKRIENMMKKDWSNYGIVVLLPFLFVAIVYATEAFIRTSFFACSNRDSNCESIPQNIWKVLRFESDGSTVSSTASASDLTGNDEERKAIALRYSGRMAWFILGEFYLYICAACLGIGSLLTSQLIPQRPILWGCATLTLSAIVGLFFYRHPQVHMAIFLAIFAKAITPDLPAISDLTNRLNSLGNAALFSLLVASCLALLPSLDESSPEGLKQLSRRMKYLRLILYAGTSLLVTTVLLKKSIYEWALAYTPQDGAIETARNFVASLLTLDGGFYTLVLAAAYLPAALLLYRRAQLLIGPSLDEAEKESKLKEYGLSFSLKESLPRILAILGPFLTGPAADFLTGNFF